jgi:ribonuclease R
MFKSKPSKFSKDSTGTVKRHPDGFGFFISDLPDDPDVYIPRKAMTGVMSNDRVKVRITPEPGGDRFRGEIIEVLARNTKRAMGAFHETAPGRGLILDKSAWGEDLRVEVPPGTAVKNGDLVAVAIEDYPDSEKGFWGKVVAVLGDIQDPMNDSLRILHAQSIPFEFTKATLKEADSLPSEVPQKDIQGRKDLRSLPIITIDGKTAKDFDDAIVVEKTAAGFHLIVAIADVSHYVKPGSAIDDDAYLRGTSTYFPNFVAPMLPEKLSNELCSLKPKVNRLALVADMQLDFSGTLTKYDFYEGVIESKARVTYGEAQEVVEGRCPANLEHVKENILLSADLAKILMQKRFREGSLDLEIPETEIVLDDTGLPVDIMQSERLFAHRLIEEMMLTANVAVARFFKDREIEGIYRIHEPPNADAMANFENFLKAFGFTHSLSGGLLQRKITKALEHFKNHPKEHVLHILALRSLSQAKYSPNNVGHFGLGFADYTHFTSPIRRYPDLIVHRLIKALICPEKGYSLIPLDQLETAGAVLSATEQRSVKAERMIKSIKKARFMSQHLGEEFDGIISSVTKFGIFVLLRQFDVDGLVRLEDLGDDYFEYDEENLRLVGRKSGMSYEIGEPVKITVAKTDIDSGQIDLVLTGVEKRQTTDRGSYKQKRTSGREEGAQVFGRHRKGGQEKDRGGRGKDHGGRKNERSARGGGGSQDDRNADRNGVRNKDRSGGQKRGPDRSGDRKSFKPAEQGRNKSGGDGKKFEREDKITAGQRKAREKSQGGRREEAHEDRPPREGKRSDSDRKRDLRSPVAKSFTKPPDRLQFTSSAKPKRLLDFFRKREDDSVEEVSKTKKRSTPEEDRGSVRSTRVSKRRRPR